MDCSSISKPDGKFVIKEVLGDTSFIADTIYRNNYVQFMALDNYESVNWNLGSDPRIWTNQNFSLSLINALGNIPINFIGRRNPNINCFPQDSGNYMSSQKITMVEQIEKPILKISPLVGKYKGVFSNNLLDTFTIRIEYFDSLKYDIGVTGSKNFYWISNIPKSYTSTLGWNYPELLNGQPIQMGYKCFRFGSNSNVIQGKGWLNNENIYISYGNDLVGRKTFVGKKL